MASYHRMLFPGFGNGVDTCFECMIHSPFDSNNYLPPPPPPQLNDHNKNEIYAIITVAVSVFSAGFLLITFCILIIRYFSKQRSRSLGSQNIDHDEDHVEIHNSMNYVWYVRTMGLEDSVIKSIVEWKFKKGEGLIEGRECAVCLNEFQEGERLRLLPKCSHAFHIYCIDTWLKSHVNCPLCRAHIVSNIDNSSVSGLNQGSSSAIQETHMINATRTSSERHQTDNLNDNRSTIHPHWEESQFKDGPFYFESIQGDLTVHVGHEYRVFSDLVHDRRLDKRKIGPVNEIQSKRRSLSLDTFYASMINSSLNN